MFTNWNPPDNATFFVIDTVDFPSDITVELHDINDVLMPEFNGTVTLTLVIEQAAPPPPVSELHGVLVQDAVNGVATFPGISITYSMGVDEFGRLGFFAHIHATSPGEIDGDSPSFDFGIPS